MMIFFRRVPADLTRRELEQIVCDAIKPRFWGLVGPKGSVARCEILCIHDKDSGERERHGLVSVVPQAAAQTALNRLNPLRIKGRVVEVRPYVKRVYQRDRRQTGEGVTTAGEQRRQDRRRPNLTEGFERSPQIEALVGFHRVHGE
jgi:hypothetical protein